MADMTVQMLAAAMAEMTELSWADSMAALMVAKLVLWSAVQLGCHLAVSLVDSRADSWADMSAALMADSLDASMVDRSGR